MKVILWTTKAGSVEIFRLDCTGDGEIAKSIENIKYIICSWIKIRYKTKKHFEKSKIEFDNI